MNLVERFFADLTQDVIRTGSFASVKELVRDIEAYLAKLALAEDRARASAPWLVKKVARIRIAEVLASPRARKRGLQHCEFVTGQGVWFGRDVGQGL